MFITYLTEERAVKLIITREMTELDYKSNDFWQQFDEVEVACPTGIFATWRVE